jgi:hypothetical protein
MLKTLLNKLRWDETMAIAAFAEVGDFWSIERAVKKEKKGRSNSVRSKRKIARGVLVHEN